ncbi:hypothetical protein BH11BAC3_BH11BAC3_13990 [soil metagenome]
MSVLEENFKRVNLKLQQLLKHVHVLRVENGQLLLDKKKLSDHRENDLAHITQLEQQVAILKSAAGQMTEADKKSFEKNINQYIRELDKCIGLLSE